MRRIAFPLLIAMGIVSYLIYGLAHDVMIEEEEMRHQSFLDKMTSNVDRTLTEIQLGINNYVPEIENNIDNPDLMYDCMKEIVQLNPNIRSSGITFVADYYPQKGHWYCPYAVQEDDGTMTVKNMGSADYDYLNRKWFKDALASKEPSWSDPFFEANDSLIELVSYLVPIHDKQGRTVAILGADMSLKWLQEKITEWTREIIDQQWITVDSARLETDIRERSRISYGFIVTEDGTFIAHPNTSYILRKNFYTSFKETPDTLINKLGNLLTSGKKGYYDKGVPLLQERNDSINKKFEGNLSYFFYAPIKQANWSMGLVVPSLNIDFVAITLSGLLMLLIIVAIFIVSTIGHLVIKRAVKPLNALANAANEVAKGNFTTELPQIKSRDEIHQLRDSFADMQQSLTTYVEELKTTTASKASMENELKIAHGIQMAMLPKTFPAFPDRKDIDLYGSVTPAKAVGGDLFDFFIRDEKLFFCVGDVSGKGVPASLVMAVTRSLFRNVANYVPEPHLTVKALNNSISKGNESNMFVTLFVGELDLTTGLLRYCNAGHDAPVLISEKDCRELPCDPNIPVGIMADWEYTGQEVKLESHTTIFLYTDGLNEAENLQHEQFEMERVYQVAERLRTKGEMESENVVKQMGKAVKEFVGEAEQSDDLTLLAVRYLK